VEQIAAYFEVLKRTLTSAEVSRADGAPITIGEAVQSIVSDMRQAHDVGRKLMFVGNGGSAGICSHMATDYSKNGKIRSMAFNDSSALTCIGNDLGYERVFAEQIEFHGNPGDILIAISSSGRSPNILNAVETAKKKSCKVVTLSGFESDNPLRRAGDLNIFLLNKEYGFVEVGHLAILHAVLDLHMGWRP
jgi:D-sedoheptulose 7-phosphate isomerase